MQTDLALYWSQRLITLGSSRKRVNLINFFNGINQLPSFELSNIILRDQNLKVLSQRGCAGWPGSILVADTKSLSIPVGLGLKLYMTKSFPSFLSCLFSFPDPVDSKLDGKTNLTEGDNLNLTAHSFGR